MRTSKGVKRASGLVSTLFLLAAPAWGQDETFSAATPPSDPAAQEDDSPEALPASGATYARIRHFEGGISLRREDEATPDQAELAANSPLIPGDQVWTGGDGRLEVQLADGTILRLDRNSRLTLQNLADHEAAFDNTTLLRLMNGSLYIRVDSFDPQSRRFQVDTPGGSIFILSSGVFRIDVGPTGVSTVASYRGVAEVLGDDMSVMAHSGERVTVEPGRRPTEARAFNTLRRDPFDVWSEDRDGAYASTGSGRGQRPEVPEPVRPYLGELSYYGNWRWDASYGWIWIPDDVAPDWRPYYYGQWAHSPVGLTWVSYEPWGWAPYHYGRWHWAGGFGWFWIPGFVFSPAYVSWAIGPSYWGWCPLGFYDYPVYVGTYYPWAFVPYGSIYSPYVYRHVYSWSDVAHHRMYHNSYVLHAAPVIRPGYRPELVGGARYKKLIASPHPGYTAFSPGQTRKASFRDDDQGNYRRLIARQAKVEPGNGNGKAGLGPKPLPAERRPSEPRMTAPRVQPMARPGSQGPLKATPVSLGTVGSARRSGYTVSPATGRPMQPTVKVAPARGSTTRAPGVSYRSGTNHQAGAPAPKPREEMIRPGQRRAAPAQPGIVAPPPAPHPRVEPGRNGKGRDIFVMPTRPNSGVSNPSKVSPPPSRPSAGARPAPAPKGGGDKGRKGGKG